MQFPVRLSTVFDRKSHRRISVMVLPLGSGFLCKITKKIYTARRKKKIHCRAKRAPLTRALYVETCHYHGAMSVLVTENRYVPAFATEARTAGVGFCFSCAAQNTPANEKTPSDGNTPPRAPKTTHRARQRQMRRRECNDGSAEPARRACDDGRRRRSTFCACSWYIKILIRFLQMPPQRRKIDQEGPAAGG